VFEAFSGHIVCGECLAKRAKAIADVFAQWGDIVALPTNANAGNNPP
jgi:hypothetical protein